MVRNLPGAGHSGPGRRPALKRSRALLAVLALWGAAWMSSPAAAQVRVIPVHFWAAGKVIPLKTSAVSTGKDTYVPLAALPAIGARGTLTARRDGVSVRLHNGRIDILSYVRHNGLAMISLRDLAEFANASVIKPNPAPSPGLKPNTAYILAHVTDVRLQGSSLRVITSFPVPFVSNTITGTSARGYVDCIGAAAAGDVRPFRLPAGERRIERVRIGQFAPDIARVVADLAPGVALERVSTQGKVTASFAAALESRSRLSGTAGRTRRTARTNTDPDLSPPPRTHRTDPGRTTLPDDVNTDPNGDRIPPPRSTGSPRTTPGSTRVADIRSISYETQDSQSIQILIETTRKARAYVRYSATTRQVIVDIPNSRLNLEDDRQKDQDIQHPLIDGLSAATVQNSPRVPPLTRITIDAPRMVATSVESDNNQIVLEITIPKSSRNNRVRPTGGGHGLVVVDAGHGGALTGAKARYRGRTVYEKNITLAIASRIRAALEARGTRVVMTRNRDVNVPLEDRPRLANELGADVFISIHNDSWGKADSITGTTTYYHGKNAESRRLARCVQKELAAATGLRDRGAMSDTTMYPIGFCVLRDTGMPAVLLEVGYLNNSKDRSRLMEPVFQQRIAEAVCNGIRNYAAGVQNAARRHGRKTAPAV